MHRVKFGRGDDLCQLLHVGWFDIYDVCTRIDPSNSDDQKFKEPKLTEAAVTNVEIPKINPEIVSGKVGLLI